MARGGEGMSAPFCHWMGKRASRSKHLRKYYRFDRIVLMKISKWVPASVMFLLAAAMFVGIMIKVAKYGP